MDTMGVKVTRIVRVVRTLRNVFQHQVLSTFGLKCPVNWHESETWSSLSSATVKQEQRNTEKIFRKGFALKIWCMFD